MRIPTSPTFYVVSVFKISPFGGCAEVSSHCGFKLQFADIEWYWMRLNKCHVLIGTFVYLAIWIFYCFAIKNIFFSLLHCPSSSYILHTSLLPDTHFVTIFSVFTPLFERLPSYSVSPLFFSFVVFATCLGLVYIYARHRYFWGYSEAPKKR